MRVNADLDRIHTQRTNAPCLRLTDQNRIGFQLDAESQLTGVLQDLEEVFAKQDLSAAQREKKDSCRGKLVEQVYRAGTPDRRVPPGLYAEYLAKANEYLAKARAFASPAQAKTIDDLIRYYQTGEYSDWLRFGIDWVQDDEVVDFANRIRRASVVAMAASKICGLSPTRCTMSRNSCGRFKANSTKSSHPDIRSARASAVSGTACFRFRNVFTPLATSASSRPFLSP